MKTAEGSLLGMNEHMEFISSAAPQSVGRLHVDAAVRYLLGVPRALPERESPGLRLEGRDGMWIEILRREPGRIFSLSMKDGETDLNTDEMQAVSRVRLFIEHWGTETDLTAEIRLSPEMRRQIADGELARDAERRQRMADGPNRVVFRKRVYMVPCLLLFAATATLAGILLLVLGTSGVPGAAAAALLALGSIGSLWLLFKTYRVEIDRQVGVIEAVAFNGASLVGELDEIQHADINRQSRIRDRVGVFVMTRDGEKLSVGNRSWLPEDAAEIAEAINDAVDLPEVDRKFLAYRRRQGRDNP